MKQQYLLLMIHAHKKNSMNINKQYLLFSGSSVWMGGWRNGSKQWVIRNEDMIIHDGLD